MSSIFDCKECCVGKIQLLKHERRLELVSKILEACASPPVAWLSQVVETHITHHLMRENVAEAEIQSLAALLLPKEPDADPTAFTTATPCLSGLDAKSTAAGTHMGQIMLHALLALISAGQKLAPRTAAWCRAVKTCLGENEPRCRILQAASAQVCAMADCALLLADDTSLPPTIAPLEAIWSSKAQGPKTMLKMALVQNPWYKSQESWLRSSYSAALSLQPKLKELEVGVLARKIESLTSFTDELAAIRSALRPGQTLQLEGEFSKALHEVIDKECEARDEASLKSLLEICKRASSVPCGVNLHKAGVTNESYQKALAKVEKALGVAQLVGRKTLALNAVSAFVRLAKRGNMTDQTALTENAKVLADLYTTLKSWCDSEVEDEEVKESASGALPLISTCLATTLSEALGAMASSDEDLAYEFFRCSTTLTDVARLVADPSVQVKDNHVKVVELSMQGQSIDVSKVAQGEFINMASKLLSTVDACRKSNEEQLTLFKPVIDRVLEYVESMQRQLCSTIQDTVEQAAAKIKIIARGEASGKSWKESLPEEAPWPEVVKASTTLCSGATAHLVSGYKHLKQDLATAEG